MNAARLARRLQEANNDPTRVAEAIHDEVTDPSAGLVTRDHLDRRLHETEIRLREHMDARFVALDQRFVTRDHLDARFAQLDARFGVFEARMLRTVIGIQVATALTLFVAILMR